MLTNLKTYEGVPIGGNNFEDFLEYVREFLGANFGFSTNVLTNDGGYFAGDNFNYYSKNTGGPTEAFFLTPDSATSVGSLFGKKGNEYYRFEVLSADGQAPQVHEWELLPTISSTIDTLFTYQNIDFNNKVLPYRPLKKDTATPGYVTGYEEVRFNGIPQTETDIGFTIESPPTGFAEQTFTISKFTLGAEYPKPVRNGRYDDTFTATSGVTKQELLDNYDNVLVFPYTNFGIDFGGHIVITRTTTDGNTLYEYIPQDTSSGEDVRVGYYKVKDYSRGEISLNISSTQINQILNASDVGITDTTARFKVLSLEQLQDDSNADVTNYYTRYGEIYDGNDAQVELLEYIFDGQSHILREIPGSEYISSEGSLLLQDSSQQYSDGIVLAVSYKGNTNKSRLIEAQYNRYEPDTIQLYYHSGTPASIITTTANIRGFVEQNPSSWYNRSVLDAEYYPISRAESSYVSFISDAEAAHADFSGQITFDPNIAFKIVDTIGLSDLNDISGTPADNEILKYDSGTAQWLTVAHVLNELNDVNASTPSANDILSFDGTNWVPRNLASGVLGYTPLARSGGTQTDYTVATGQRLYYNQALTSPPAAAGGAVSDALGDLVMTPTGYVKGAVNNHNARDDAHGAVSTATANKIIRRDSSGRALVVAPDTDGSDQIATANWVFNTKAKTTADINTLVKRDGSGIAQVATPTVGNNSNQIANTAWVQSMSTSAPTASRIIIRDSNGRAQVVDPSAASDIATKNYVDNALSSGGSLYTPPTQTATAWSGAINTGDNTVLNITSHVTSTSNLSVTNSNYITLPGTKKGIQTCTVQWLTTSGYGQEYIIRVRPLYPMSAIYSGSIMMGSVGNARGHIATLVDDDAMMAPLVYLGGYSVSGNVQFAFAFEKIGESIEFDCTIFGVFV